MKQKDYYTILGVTRKTSKEEIKLNYRKLAKKYHPDTNTNQDAELIFKDVTEAYNILIDDEKKKVYDKQVIKYKYGFDNLDKTLPNVKYEIKPGMNVINDLLSTILGFKKDESFNSNFEDSTKFNKAVAKRGTDIESTLEISLEEAFLGTEKKIAIKGYKGGIKTFTVNVPVGIKDSDKIRLASLGMPGKNGGKNGDLIITIKIKENEDIKVKGLNLTKTIVISPALAIIGGKYKLNILNESFFIDLPGCLQNGQIIEVKGKGYILENKSRGDLLLTIKIENPTSITDRELKLYEQIYKLECKKTFK